MKKSKVISFAKFRQELIDIIIELANDQVNVYAAQASFFIIISVIPFIILLLSLAKYVIDVDWIVGWIEQQISGDIGQLLQSVLAEVTEKAGISLVSITAISTLWSSSRGVNAVIRGVPFYIPCPSFYLSLPHWWRSFLQIPSARSAKGAIPSQQLYLTLSYSADP